MGENAQLEVYVVAEDPQRHMHVADVRSEPPRWRLPRFEPMACTVSQEVQYPFTVSGQYASRMENRSIPGVAVDLIEGRLPSRGRANCRPQLSSVVARCRLWGASSHRPRNGVIGDGGGTARNEECDQEIDTHRSTVAPPGEFLQFFADFESVLDYSRSSTRVAHSVVSGSPTIVTDPSGLASAVPSRAPNDHRTSSPTTVWNR
jgi:hypothetical protein